jgi:hypothetical protein
MITKLFKENTDEFNRTDLYFAEQLINFLKNNPYPTDDKIHRLAEVLCVEPKILEEVAYGLLTAFFCCGKSKGENYPMDGFETNKGIEIEFEHCDKESVYASLISNKIRSDHHAEHGGKPYYKFLVNMEEELK